MAGGLFSPGALGAIPIANRIVMAPMSRRDAAPDGSPGTASIAYFADRAGAGLIVTGSVWVDPLGRGGMGLPGIATDAHAAAWRRVTAAVHAAGGRIVLQLSHAGALAPSSLLPPGEAPVSPSGVRLDGEGIGIDGPEPFATPRTLPAAEIAALVDSYGKAAHLARAAGFDGVEIDAAGGKLIDQFLRTATNRRTDAYGGSAANRRRFLLEIIEAVEAAVGPGRAGLRLSPRVTLKGVGAVLVEEDEAGTFGALAEAVSSRSLAYLTVVERPGIGVAAIRARFDRPDYIAGGGYDPASAESAVASGAAYAVSFASPFRDRPDFAAHLRARATPQKLASTAP